MLKPRLLEVGTNVQTLQANYPITLSTDLEQLSLSNWLHDMLAKLGITQEKLLQPEVQITV
jgi:hypothetical protein